MERRGWRGEDEVAYREKLGGQREWGDGGLKSEREGEGKGGVEEKEDSKGGRKERE